MKNQSNTLSPEEDTTSSPLESLDDVTGYFRCDSDFKSVESSGPRMKAASTLASEGLEIACQVDEEVEFGALERFAVFSENEQFWVFGLKTNRPETNFEPNFFGLRLPTTSSIQENISQLAQAI